MMVLAVVSGWGDEEVVGLVEVEPVVAAEMLKREKGLVVIDIRTAKEFAAGHIEGARNIDFKREDFREQVSELDRSGGYVFHCKSGGRSAKAEKVFVELGFERLFHLKAGMDGWKAAKLPVVKGE